MHQDLSFAHYRPESDGYPSLEIILLDQWPLEIDQQEEARLVSEAGFGPEQRYRKGILFREWISKTGRKHPPDSLVVIPHINFTAFTSDEHFSVSNEKVQRVK